MQINTCSRADTIFSIKDSTAVLTATEEVIAFCKGTMNFYVFSFP